MVREAKTPKTNAMRELERAGISFSLHTYDDDGEEASGLGESIAAQLGEDPDQGFKTLVTVSPSGEYRPEQGNRPCARSPRVRRQERRHRLHDPQARCPFR